MAVGHSAEAPLLGSIHLGAGGRAAPLATSSEQGSGVDRQPSTSSSVAKGTWGDEL